MEALGVISFSGPSASQSSVPIKSNSLKGLVPNVRDARQSHKRRVRNLSDDEWLDTYGSENNKGRASKRKKKGCENPQRFGGWLDLLIPEHLEQHMPEEHLRRSLRNGMPSTEFLLEGKPKTEHPQPWKEIYPTSPAFKMSNPLLVFTLIPKKTYQL
jgi:hypothetical protein